MNSWPLRARRCSRGRGPPKISERSTAGASSSMLSIRPGARGRRPSTSSDPLSDVSDRPSLRSCSVQEVLDACRPSARSRHRGGNVRRAARRCVRDSEGHRPCQVYCSISGAIREPLKVARRPADSKSDSDWGLTAIRPGLELRERGGGRRRPSHARGVSHARSFTRAPSQGMQPGLRCPDPTPGFPRAPRPGQNLASLSVRRASRLRSTRRNPPRCTPAGRRVTFG